MTWAHRPWPLRRVGVFMIMSQMDADKVPAYTKELGALLRGLSASGFSDAAFARAKLNLEDDFYRAQETVAGMADLYGDLAFHSPGDPDGQSYLAAIRGVSRAQVQEVIDAWIRPEAMTLVALTPGSGNSAAPGRRAAQDACRGMAPGPVRPCTRSRR